MKILITGGSGFIGSYLSKKLSEEGHEVLIYDIKKPKNKINYLKGDVLNFQLLKKAVKNKDVVFHLAAVSSVQDSFKNPLKTFEVNISGTFNVLKASLESGIKRVIFASSASVYGNQGKIKLKENMLPKPRSFYAISKLTGEHLCKMFYEEYGLETVILRYFNVYGPKQQENVIKIFLENLKKGKEIIIYGDGKQKRDFIHIDDVTRANILAMKTQKAKGKVFNIGTGEGCTILQLIQTISQILGKRPKIRFLKERKGDIKYSVADIMLAKKILRFDPKMDLKTGLLTLLKS